MSNKLVVLLYFYNYGIRILFDHTALHTPRARQHPCS